MRGFIEELRRRNVFRVGVAYVVAGWLIVQVADIAADAFNAPDWFMQMLIIVLIAYPCGCIADSAFASSLVPVLA